LKTNLLKNKLIVFVICLSVVLPGLISEVITTNNILSQDNDIQMGKLSVDNPIGGGNFVINSPTQLSPDDGLISYDRTVTITWEQIFLSDNYNLVIDNNADFSSPIINVNTGASETYTTGSLSDGIYYWHVRNHWILWGSFSETWSFRVYTAPLTLVSPPSGRITFDNTRFLDWNSYLGVDYYQLLLDDNPSFSSPVYYNTPYSYDTTSILPDGTYYWKVRARDAADYWSSYSSYRYFTVETTPPVLVSPTPGYYTNDATPYLDWNGVSGANLYQVQVSANSAFSAIVYSATTTATGRTTTTLSEGIKYWHVRARDVDGYWGPYCSYSWFYVDTVAPSTPILYSPIDGFVSSDTTPYLDWSHVSGANQYQLQVSLTGSFVATVVDIETSETAYTVNPPLADTTYFWRVRAQDAAGNWGDWSVTEFFRIDTTDPVFTSVSHSPTSPNDTERATISCDISDASFISYVRIYMRVNGGSWSIFTMSYVSGDTWSITSQIYNYADVVEYYITATDCAAPTPNVGMADNGGLYYNFTVVSSDVTGPTIENVQHEPLTPTDNQNVNITCTVTDPNGIQNVTLYYRIDQGAWLNISMTLLSGSTYNATIGTFNYNELIEYYIYATDDYVLHNSATEDNSGLYYSFTILSGDVTTPVISSISHTPTTPNELDYVTISCDATDTSGILSVYVYFRVDGGSWSVMTMSHTSGDTYERNIGTFYYTEVIEYCIRANDNSPNQNTILDDNGGLNYSFTIVSSDVTGPTINTVTFYPTTPNTGNSINITCYAYDVNGLFSISLYYNINDNGTWIKVDMALLSDNIYRVVLDPFDDGDIVYFYIEAVDNSVAQNTAIEDNGGLNYSFTVLQPTTILTPITYLIPMITMFSVILVLRKRK